MSTRFPFSSWVSTTIIVYNLYRPWEVGSCPLTKHEEESRPGASTTMSGRHHLQTCNNIAVSLSDSLPALDPQHCCFLHYFSDSRTSQRGFVSLAPLINEVATKYTPSYHHSYRERTVLRRSISVLISGAFAIDHKWDLQEYPDIENLGEQLLLYFVLTKHS